jgi:hypothetical protein
MARFNGTPCMVLGHQKGRDTKERAARNFGMPRPEGYRKAMRLMRLAEKFNLPVDPNDSCHMDELKIPVEQIRWFEEGKDNQKTIKIEYPEHLFKE